MWVSTTRTKHPAPISCKREHTVFALKNKIVEPENSIDAGSKATNALSSRAFMPVGKARNLRRGSRQFVFRIENNYSNLTQKYFRIYPSATNPVSAHLSTFIQTIAQRSVKSPTARFSGAFSARLHMIQAKMARNRLFAAYHATPSTPHS